ncbi:MAG: DUF2061 domain-containing protein [Flavobacteriales bacterium]|nr:DUF2061 domain-containing protein [Flavobacteriales bacterium]
MSEPSAKIIKPKVERKRHIAKTITWRIVGSIDTFIISTFFTSSIEKGFLIAILEIISKTVLYYFHERAWYSFDWKLGDQKRHLLKTLSWRFVGAMDTILLVMIVSYFKDGTTQGAIKIALSIFSIELISKIILYYLHERIWHKSNWGVIKTED